MWRALSLVAPSLKLLPEHPQPLFESPFYPIGVIPDQLLQPQNLFSIYRDTYAMTNADEYWAEGVQDFFDASRPGYGAGGGGDGYDGPIYDRETLRQEDPVLYSLIVEVFTEVDFSPVCPR